MSRKVPLHTTEAAAAELGARGFYLKLFENTLLYCASPSSVRPIRARAYNINTPKKIYKIQRIEPLIKICIFLRTGTPLKTCHFCLH